MDRQINRTVAAIEKTFDSLMRAEHASHDPANDAVVQDLRKEIKRREEHLLNLNVKIALLLQYSRELSS